MNPIRPQLFTDGCQLRRGDVSQLLIGSEFCELENPPGKNAFGSVVLMTSRAASPPEISPGFIDGSRNARTLRDSSQEKSDDRLSFLFRKLEAGETYGRIFFQAS